MCTCSLDTFRDSPFVAFITRFLFFFFSIKFVFQIPTGSVCEDVKNATSQKILIHLVHWTVMASTSNLNSRKQSQTQTCDSYTVLADPK
jgi:hypothetical protein